MNTCLMHRCRADVLLDGDVCEDCWSDRRGQLASLPDLYLGAYAQLAPGAKAVDIMGVNVRSIDPAAPLNLVVLDTLNCGYAKLTTWATWAARLANLPRPMFSRYTTGRSFLTAVHLLLQHDGRFALASYAGEYVLDIWTVYRRLVVQCVSTSPRHLGVACPSCHTTSVVSRHADEYAVCLTCGDEWSHSQFPKLRQIAQRVA